MPEPQRGGDIGLLWQHTNIPANRRVMVLTWLLDSFRPDTPFPVLELVGEQGSAKSTTQAVLRSLIDPNKVMLRGRPKTVEDIFVAAANNWLVSYENLSGLTAEQQDAFCTLSTGGGFASRQLYTNGEEHVMETKRPVVLNGIAVVATRPDLIDRVIHVDMPMIPPEARKDDADTSAAWERDRSLVFGALLDLFADALRILPTVKLAHKQRMADYEHFGEAVARALGFEPGEFQRQYAVLLQRVHLTHYSVTGDHRTRYEHELIGRRRDGELLPTLIEGLAFEDLRDLNDRFTHHDSEFATALDSALCSVGFDAWGLKVYHSKGKNDERRIYAPDPNPPKKHLDSYSEMAAVVRVDVA